MDVQMDIQYVADLNRVYEAFYRLSAPEQQINSYVFDVVRSAVPKHTLDDLYLHAAKDQIADEVKGNLKVGLEDESVLVCAVAALGLRGPSSLPPAGIDRVLLEPQHPLKPLKLI